MSLDARPESKPSQHFYFNSPTSTDFKHIMSLLTPRANRYRQFVVVMWLNNRLSTVKLKNRIRVIGWENGPSRFREMVNRTKAQGKQVVKVEVPPELVELFSRLRVEAGRE